MPEQKLLSEREVAEIEAHLHRLKTPGEPWESKTDQADTFKNVAARHALALCKTVRAARASVLAMQNAYDKGRGEWVTANNALREQLARERLRTIQAIKAKRDGPTARYAYGGYSRELWHLNVETLKTVCKELLKEVTDALAFDTASNPLGDRIDLDAGTIHKAEGVDHEH